MMMSLQIFNLVIEYKSGKQMFIADTLSRDFIKKAVSEDLSFEVIATVEEDAYTIKLEDELQISNKTIENIRKAT